MERRKTGSGSGTSSHGALLAVAAALVALASTEAAARDPKEEATELFKEGNALYDRGEHAAALEKFQKAKAIFPSPRIDLNIATVLGDLGRPAEAAEAYEVFLERGSEVGSAEIVDAARAKLDELRAKLGRVSVKCAVEGATLTLDRTPAGTTPRARPIYLAPGAHQIEVCKQDHRCSSASVTVAAGEQRELTLQPEPSTAERKPADGSTPPGPGAPRGRSWKVTAGWTAVGLGGASLIAGIALGVMVSRKSDEHRQAAAEGKSYGELQEIADSGRSFEKAEIATLVVGGVVLAAGGGILLWHLLGERRGKAQRSAFVAPLLGGSVHGVLCGARF